MSFDSVGSKSTTSGGSQNFRTDAFDNETFREPSTTLYAKNNEKVDLSDFTIKKVIGRGSFGKVFLVEKNDTKEVFAMKSLRKDVIIDYDQVESTKLEKEILLKVSFLMFVLNFFLNRQTILSLLE